MRKDAGGYVAAEIAVCARKIAQALDGYQVATVGALTLSPNLINVVPNHVVMTVDLRNTDEDRLQDAERHLFDFAQRAAATEGRRPHAAERSPVLLRSASRRIWSVVSKRSRRISAYR